MSEILECELCENPVQGNLGTMIDHDCVVMGITHTSPATWNYWQQGFAALIREREKAAWEAARGRERTMFEHHLWKTFDDWKAGQEK